ncbi:hypothetical protein C6W18_17815 [Bacillus sp. LLTC93]|nr:hypothetical protein C6W18_17815 [Bacillus sp. LLTC93]
MQVFEIINISEKIKITNRQEQPAMMEELVIWRGPMEIEDTIVWIIDDLEYQKMLLRPCS